MSCIYYRWNGGLFGDYWCDKKDSRVDDKYYDKYCKDYNYNECSIYKANDSSSLCFITTIVCNILGKSDNDKVLNNLRFFREEVLKKDKKNHDILMDYDHMGPIIASSIYNDKDKEKISEFLYQSALSKISKLIEEKQYEEVINKYEIMVLHLINYYGLKHLYNLGKDTNYDSTFELKTSGHGKKLKKK